MSGEGEYLRYWCPSRRCQKVVIFDSDTCPTCLNGPMVLLDELDGVVTEEGKGVLRGFETYHEATAQPHRKQKGKHVELKCRKCGRQKFEVSGGERMSGMLMASVPTRMPSPGVEICNCEAYGQHPPAPAGEFVRRPKRRPKAKDKQAMTGRSPLDLGGDKTK